MQLLNLKTSIARYLISIILIIVTISLSAIGLLVYQYTSIREWGELRNNQDISAKKLASGLSLAVWSFDNPQINAIVESEFGDKNVYGLIVNDNKNTFFWLRDKSGLVQEVKQPFSTLNLVEVERKIRYGHDDIGYLKLYVTPKWLNANLKLMRWYIFGGIITLDIALVFGLYLALRRAVIRPLQLLENYARNIKLESATSQLEAGPYFYGELESLKQSFIAMVENLNNKNSELTKSAERLSRLVQYFPIPVAICNDDSQITYLNSTFTKKFGYIREDVPNLAMWFENAYPDIEYRKRVLDQWAVNLANALNEAKVKGSGNIESGSYKVATKSRETRDVEIGGLYMQDFSVAFFMDVTERVQYESERAEYSQHLEELVLQRTKELEYARAEAESANRAKSTFLSNMSHELRTPLNSVIGYAQLLGRDTSFNRSQKSNLEIIYRSANHLLNLINSVLELSKIEAGATTLMSEYSDIRTLVCETVDMMRIRAEEVNLDLRLELDELPDLVLIDAFKLKQVLLNLLSNAIKFTSVGQVTLKVSVNEQDDNEIVLCFDVIDTGHGIPASEIIRIFDPFVQLDTFAKNVGTGLGLSISKKFIELMGSELKVESSKGKGSVFSFNLTLPVGKEKLSHDKEQFSWLNFKDIGIGKRILIVDDTSEARSLLKQMLLPLGAEIVEAKSGNEAKEHLVEFLPDLVFMDWQMQDGDGLSAIEWMRSMRHFRQPKIVMMTAYTFSDKKEQALQAGANEFITKPIVEKDLYSILSSYFGTKLDSSDKLEPNSSRLMSDNYIAEVLVNLSQIHLDTLINSALQLDMTLIEHAISNIQDENPDFAEYLNVLNRSMQYRRLWEILGIPSIGH